MFSVIGCEAGLAKVRTVVQTVKWGKRARKKLSSHLATVWGVPWWIKLVPGETMRKSLTKCFCEWVWAVLSVLGCPACHIQISRSPHQKIKPLESKPIVTAQLYLQGCPPPFLSTDSIQESLLRLTTNNVKKCVHGNKQSYFFEVVLLYPKESYIENWSECDMFPGSSLTIQFHTHIASPHQNWSAYFEGWRQRCATFTVTYVNEMGIFLQ